MLGNDEMEENDFLTRIVLTVFLFPPEHWNQGRPPKLPFMQFNPS